MHIAIERKPPPRRSEMPHSLYPCQGAQLIKPITGINDRCTTWLCFLSQELYGFQLSWSPNTPFISLALFLHLQYCLKLLLCLLLCSLRLHRQPYCSCLRILILVLSWSPCLILAPSLPCHLKSPLFYGVYCTLYTGLKACAQLHITTRRLRLFPICPSYKFSQGPAEFLPYSHGAHLWPFIKRHKATFH